MTLDEIEKEFLEHASHSSDCAEADFARQVIPKLLMIAKTANEFFKPQEDLKSKHCLEGALYYALMGLDKA